MWYVLMSRDFHSVIVTNDRKLFADWIEIFSSPIKKECEDYAAPYVV